MTPRFAEAVDPIFLYVVDLLDRIGASESLDPSAERLQIRSRIDRAESKLGQSPDWELAKYALTAWIDEVLIEAPWEGRRWWEEKSLEFDLFNTRDRFTEFYHRSTKAAELSKKDALEVYYVCVVLGFRGIYRDPSAALLADQLQLPPTLDAWAKKAALAIHLGQGVPPILEAPRPATGAPPLEGKFLLIGAGMGGVVLSFILMAMILWSVIR
jgi:type VI secretion system protein ImpK